MRTRNLIIAGLAGAAFVAGGFWAGTLGSPDGAEAVSDATAAEELTDEAAERSERARADRGDRGDRSPRWDPGYVAQQLGLDVEAFRESIVDGATIAEAAEAQGVGRDELVEAIVAEGSEAIDRAVENGRIDEDRAAELTEALTERVERFVDRTPANWRFVREHPVAAAGLTNAAEVIGIEAADLADALRDGQSVAEVAEANGVSRDELVSGLLEIAEERIERWVDRVPGENADG